MEKKANEHKPVGSEETSHRGARIGHRDVSGKAHTRKRIVGDDDAPNKPSLDVAAFNSFIG